MAATDPKLILYTLGEAVLKRDGKPVQGFKESRKATGALAYLLSERPKAVSRDDLAVLIYGTEPMPEDRHRLNQLLSTIRKRLAPEATIEGESRLQIQGDIAWDVDLARSARKAGDLARVAELHRGPFLPGSSTGDVPGFLEWIRRQNARIAKEFGEPTPTLSRTIRRPRIHRPMRFQRRLLSVAGVAAALLLAVGLLVSRLPATTRVAASAILVVSEPEGSVSGELREIPLVAGEWKPDAPLAFETAIRRKALSNQSRRATHVQWSPGGRRVAWNQHVLGGNTVDVYGIIDRGLPVPLVSGPRDDGIGGWLPDGRALVVSTSRWSSPGADKYDGAVLDLETRKLRQLTSGPDFYSDFFPSPDGTRIAFVRRSRDKATTAVCWTGYASLRNPVCLDPGEADVIENLRGWAGTTAVILKLTRGGRLIVRRLELKTGAFSDIADDVSEVTVSPEGRWIATRALGTDSHPATWYVSPADRPDQRRRLDLPGDRAASEVHWKTSGLTPFLDSMEVSGPDSMAPGISMQFHARGKDQRGKSISVEVPLDWWVSDSTVAQVDSTGALVARMPGSVTVFASAGGWRTGERHVRITSSAWRPLLAEQWGDSLDMHWRPFGDPRPDIAVAWDGTRSFWNRGDGSYPSGAYLRQQLDASQGLGVRARISAPVREVQWQQVQLILQGGVNRKLLDGWDHTTQAPPTSAYSAYNECGFEFPGGEGAERMGTVAFNLAGANAFLAAPRRLGDGKWHEVWLQIFPDLTCGLAIDGVPLLRSSVALDLQQLFDLWLVGASVKTKVLVGPLEVWQGVRPGIEWGRAPR